MKNTVWVSKLSRLMRSLSKSQKRDFKKYVNFWATDSKTTRKYIQLFDVVQRHISSSKEEASLTGHILELQKFGKTVKDVSSLAQYLYLKILESMRTTPDSSRYLNQLNAMEQDLVFLYNKNLFGDCSEIIKRALPLARELDKPALEMEWNFWAYRMKGWAIEYFNDESIR